MSRVLSVLVVATIATTAMGAQLLAQGFYAGHEYRVYSDSPATYSAAQATASALGPGWYTATTVTSAENNFVKGLLTGHTGEFWFGLVRTMYPNSPSNFAWATGEPYCYQNWNGGEPNGDGWNCGIYGTGGIEGKWNDEGQSSISGYVLENGDYYTSSASYCCPSVLDECNSIQAICNDIASQTTALNPSCLADTVYVKPICDIATTLHGICLDEVTYCHQVHDASCTC